MDLPGAAAAGGNPAGHLPQGDRLPLARPVADRQCDRRVGQVVGMLPAAVIGAGDGGERVGGQVGGRALAPGQQVEPGPGDVGEQGRDQPPRSKQTVTRRPSPATWRSCGSSRRSSPASESDGSAATMNTGSPSWPVTQVPTMAGAGNFSRAMCVFCTSRVP
jgi:hypothetical protein